MATKIFDEYDLSSGASNSTEITDVGDLTIQITVASSTDNVEVKYTLKAKEGSGAYVPVLDDYKNEISFHTFGNQSKRISVMGINSESVVLYAQPNGATGLLTVEYTKTTNNNS